MSVQWCFIRPTSSIRADIGLFSTGNEMVNLRENVMEG